MSQEHTRRMVEGEDAARDEAQKLPQVVTQADQRRLQQFITEIKSAEQQVGEHIVRALQSDDTVAVLTTVVVGRDGGQRIVSAGLDPDMLGEVQRVLMQAEQQREEEIPCIGFHCYVNRKKTDDAAGEGKSEGDAVEG